MEPKPEYEMSEPQNAAVLAYPVGANSQSVYQLALYPITLKVIISLSLKARTYNVYNIVVNNDILSRFLNYITQYFSV
jgi:hypothetical protein